MILLAHHEDGMMYFGADPNASRLPVKDLVKVAKAERVELLPWGCQTGDVVAGGVIQPFRLMRAANACDTLTRGARSRRINELVPVYFPTAGAGRAARAANVLFLRTMPLSLPNVTGV